MAMRKETKVIDITGKRFDRLIAIRVDESKKSPSAYWICKCDCGKTKSIRSDHLRKGEIRSCGCLHDENSSKIGKKYAKKLAGYNTIDITNKRFGRLIALRCADEGNHIHDSLWLCRCDCGTVQTFYKGNLMSGHTKSCGCIMSKFEEKVAKLLSENNIPFRKNATFDSCRFENGSLAKFDFYVDDKFIIECDGIQHKGATYKHFTKEAVNKTIERDRFKDKWCHDHDIPIIRLYADDIKNLDICRLLPYLEADWK